ncbi:MAG: ABC transporter ATP-binding protein, partial [Acetatifactor sp.]|nr:ABC transporter ATP-binding protein [Acetatifactor sp.]
VGNSGESTENSGSGAGTGDKRAGKNGQKRKLKFTYREQKEYDTIEGDIAALEAEIGQLDQDMLRYTSDFVRLNELTRQKETAEKALEEKMDRWIYLEDLAARIENGETVEG